MPFCIVLSYFFSLGYSWKVFEQDIVNESLQCNYPVHEDVKITWRCTCTCPQVHYWAGNEFNILFQRFEIGGLGNWRLIKIFLYWDWVTVFRSLRNHCNQQHSGIQILRTPRDAPYLFPGPAPSHTWRERWPWMFNLFLSYEFPTVLTHTALWFHHLWSMQKLHHV